MRLLAVRIWSAVSFRVEKVGGGRSLNLGKNHRVFHQPIEFLEVALRLSTAEVTVSPLFLQIPIVDKYAAEFHTEPRIQLVKG